MVNVPWMAPGKRLGDDDTCLYIAVALNIALDLSLNKITTLSTTLDGRKLARADCIDPKRALLMDGFDDVDPAQDLGRRLLRRRERAWIALFVVERGYSLLLSSALQLLNLVLGFVWHVEGATQCP